MEQLFFNNEKVIIGKTELYFYPPFIPPLHLILMIFENSAELLGTKDVKV